MQPRSQRRGVIIAAIIVVVIVAAVIYGAARASLSALPEPGAFETWLATTAKNWYIGRAAHAPAAPAPAHSATNIAAGGGLYGMECAFCHGTDPHTLAPIAHSMYPRVLNLSLPQVQAKSDPELFWVIKHGIRLSGMPGFAPINSDQDIWKLVYFVRSAAAPAK
ncbi:MAG: c-type cytochrome [Terriglobales bacterium]